MFSNSPQDYRDNGAVGALLDEYEKAISELIATIQSISNQQLVTIVDHKTQDMDCRSIQTILSHVVRAGYAYAIYIRNHQGEHLDFVDREYHESVAPYNEDLHSVFKFTESTFKDYPNIILEEHEASRKIAVQWGQLYDVEQLMEHAIVHILRHRRQIERFLLRLG